MYGISKNTTRTTVVRPAGTYEPQAAQNIFSLMISAKYELPQMDTARKTAPEIINTLNDDDLLISILMLERMNINYANYTAATRMAFDMLLENITARSSSCNQAMMIISDNASSAFEDICRVYNSEQHVRFSSYVIGREVTKYSNMTQMACNNRGYAAHNVTTLDLREYGEEYSHVFVTPMTLYKSHINTLIGTYWHAMNALRMIILAAQPVSYHNGKSDGPPRQNRPGINQNGN